MLLDSFSLQKTFFFKLGINVTFANCVGGDDPSVCALYGLGGASCLHPCKFCQVHRDEMNKASQPRTDQRWKMRTVHESNVLAHTIEGAFCPCCKKVSLSLSLCDVRSSKKIILFRVQIITETDVLGPYSEFSDGFRLKHARNHFSQQPGKHGTSRQTQLFPWSFIFCLQSVLTPSVEHQEIHVDVLHAKLRITPMMLNQTVCDNKLYF